MSKRYQNIVWPKLVTVTYPQKPLFCFSCMCACVGYVEVCTHLTISRKTEGGG